MPQITADTYVDPRVLVAPTVANLRLNEGPKDTDAKAIAILLGNAAAFDQAIKVYAWDVDDTTADNGTTFIKPTATTGAGRWRAPA